MQAGGEVRVGAGGDEERAEREVVPGVVLGHTTVRRVGPAIVVAVEGRAARHLLRRVCDGRRTAERVVAPVLGVAKVSGGDVELSEGRERRHAFLVRTDAGEELALTVGAADK